MIQERLILSPGFLLGLAILAGNDFFWKSLYHNWLTGKLSDFAGLWSISLFTIAIVRMPPRFVILSWGIVFLLWKSSYSQPLIDFWNQAGLPTVERIADPTDYIAITTLPLALIYARKRQALASLELAWLRRGAIITTIGLSLFFFTATSFVGDHVCCGEKYQFNISKSEFLSRLRKTTAQDISHVEKLSNEDGDWYSFYLKEDYCGRKVNVNIRIKEQANTTHVSVAYILYNCKQENDSFVRQRFEKEIIEPIKAAT